MACLVKMACALASSFFPSDFLPVRRSTLA